MLTDVNLFEGGNIFKDEKGQPLTTRISRENVVPTVQWLEKLTGLNLVDNMLGSTGYKETSGDLDLGVDAGKISKETLINQLIKRGIEPKDIKKSGDSVHLKTPILGSTSNGYVQTDFMFGDPNWQKFSLRGSPEGSPYKGLHRQILLASIAKAQGLKWSHKHGLVDRDTNEVITQDPKEIAARLIDGVPSDLDSVESIIKKIKDRQDYPQLTADAREAFAKDNIVLPESAPLPGTGAWFRQFVNMRNV
jgi:hypothetical protein